MDIKMAAKDCRMAGFANMLFKWITVISFLHYSSSCPTNLCFCSTNDASQTIINCVARRLTEIPQWYYETKVYYELAMQHNEFTSIPANAFENLNIEVLDLTENDISNIDDQAFNGVETYLKELLLEVKLIDTIPGSVNNLTNLESLTLIGFDLQTGLPDDVLHSLNNLKSLTIESSNIQNLTANTFLTQKDTLISLDLSKNMLNELPLELLKGLPKLKTLTLSNNKITTIPENAFLKNTALQELVLSNNLIESIHEYAFVGLQTLEQLTLNTNALKNEDLAPIGNMTSLEILNLNHNSITRIPSGTFGTNPIKTLLIQYNNIDTLSRSFFDGYSSTLEILSLQFNDIQTIDTDTFQDLDVLKDLAFSSSVLDPEILHSTEIFHPIQDTLKILHISEVPFTNNSWISIQSLKQLTTLSIQKAGLLDIPDFVFIDMSELNELDLSDNKLYRMTQEQVYGLQDSLTWVNFQDNNIPSIDECLFHDFTKLEKYYFSGNPLSCDCNLVWLKELPSDNVRAECEGLPIEYVEISEFTCDYNVTSSSAPCTSIEPPTTTTMSTTTEEITTTSTTTETTTEQIITTTEASTTTTSTTNTLQTTTEEATDPTDGPFYFTISNITHESAIINYWAIQNLASVQSLTLAIREFGGVYQDVPDLDMTSNNYMISKLSPNTNYEVIMTKSYYTQNGANRIETHVEDFTTSEKPPEPVASSSLNTGLIAGVIIGVIVVILLVILLILLFMRRSGVTGHNKEADLPQPGLPQTRAQLPQMGYNSKRFSKAKTNSMDAQNAANKSIELKLDGYTQEERDRILNLLTKTGDSTLSVISNGESVRYHPELPPRNPGQGGYLNPVDLEDEEEDHIYFEIDEQNPPGAVGGSVAGVKYMPMANDRARRSMVKYPDPPSNRKIADTQDGYVNAKLEVPDKGNDTLEGYEVPTKTKQQIYENAAGPKPDNPDGDDPDRYKEMKDANENNIGVEMTENECYI